MEGVGAVPPHGVPRPGDDHHLNVLVTEVGQALSGQGSDEDPVVPAAGDQERWPGDGRRHVDPWRLANDLLRIGQRRVELGLGHSPWPQLDLGPQGLLEPAPGHSPVEVVAEALDPLLGRLLLRHAVISGWPGEPRRVLQHACADEVRSRRQNVRGDARPHRVTDQQRPLVALAGECFQERDHVGNHDVGPVAPARGRVEAGRFAVPARVGRDDAVVVTPATHRIRPAQSRVGETVQQHQGRAVVAPQLVHPQWLSHVQKYRRVPPSLADVEADQDGRIALVPDDDGRGGVTVMMDGSPQSHVDLADPGNLGFEYIAHFAAVIDTLPAGPLAITHIGGAGLTLARYVNAERPGSPQIVLEPNAELTDLVRRELPLPRQHRIRVRPVDGLSGISQLADASADVVVLDAYANGRVPSELGTVEFLTDVSRVLRPSGTFLLNVADEPNKAYLRRVYAGLVTVFGHVALIGTHEVLKGKRFGNTVAVASHNPLDLPALRRQVAKSSFPTGLRDEAQLARQFAGSAAFTTEDSAQSPPPPPVKGWRVR